MITDYIYQNLLLQIHEEGSLVETRNYLCKTLFDLNPVTLISTPLVTFRKTAWKKALRELEWFMSGDTKCPDELLDWWRGQLDERQNYYSGYSEQLRHSRALNNKGFDQVEFILNGLRNNPNSRRLVMTTWNPWDMAHITELNNNPNTPTCCHGTLIQYFVREGFLYAYHYQRSADVLLGLPHNFIQHWALLLYFAKQSKLSRGTMRYQLGDAHIYQHETHIEATEQILKLKSYPFIENTFVLRYVGEVSNTPVFRADDFIMEGEIPEPQVTIRPVLL